MYPHYKSKEELLYAIAVRRARQILDELRSAGCGYSGGSPAASYVSGGRRRSLLLQARHYEHAKVSAVRD